MHAIHVVTGRSRVNVTSSRDNGAVGAKDMRRGVLEPDPALDGFRIPGTNHCWWCGDVATTEEHRIKASTLRRVARAEDGTAEPSNVFKMSSDYQRSLQTLKKGPQVRWRRNMCASCNNSRSQAFDRSYDVFEAFLVARFDVMASWSRLDWKDVYGKDWRSGSKDLARYFAKQLGCMLATYDLPIPDDIRQFLNGAARCPSVCFELAINPGVAKFMRSEGAGTDMSTFVGLLEAPAYRTGESFSGMDYGYYIGYLNFLVQWRESRTFSSWFDHRTCRLSRLTAEE